jgi:RNA polymerase sigma-70 factor (ECF subfamily)
MVFRIVINCCYDALRKIKANYVKTEIVGEAEMISNVENSTTSPEAIVLKTEQSQIVLKALEFLPQPQRDVLILREYNYFSYFEIAEILQISEGTVKSRLNRAKLHLRDILTEQNPDFFV